MNNAITLTAAAKQHLHSSLEASPAGTIGIRFGIRDAGCSGFAYTLDFTDAQHASDHVFAFDEVRILVANDHLPALAGTEIDYVQQGVNAVLEFNNPNVIDSCGCGESFKFKDS